MELLMGDSLETYALRCGGRLPWPVVAELSAQLLEVLEVAHARGIVHRDIKPANLLWSPGKPLRVLDFGLARFADPVPSDDLVTHDGALLGTPAFMAPEQARASLGSIGPQTDLWAVGATAFTLLTGRRVYDARSVEEQVALAATTQAPSLKERAGHVPDALAAVFQRALAYDAEDRWPSAGAMLAALRAALAGTHGTHLRDLGSSAQPVTLDDGTDAMPGAAQPSLRRATRMRIALLVTVAAGITATGWGLLRGAPSAHQVGRTSSPRVASVGTASSWSPLAPAPLAASQKALSPAVAPTPSASAGSGAPRGPVRPLRPSDVSSGARRAAARPPMPPLPADWIEEAPF